MTAMGCSDTASYVSSFWLSLSTGVERLPLSRTRNAAIDSEQLPRRILGAKFDYFFALVHGSAHARELIDAKNQLSSGLFTQADRRYLRFLTATIVGAAERRKLYPNRIRLEPDAVAELLVRSAAGNELYGTTPPTPTVFRRRLDALVRVFVVGLEGQISR